MPHYLFSNNASSILAVDLLADALDNVIQVQPGDGGLFPNPDNPTNQYFHVTLQDDSGNVEVCLCIAKTGDQLQVTRAVDGTTLRAWSSTLTRVEHRLTAGSLDNMVQEELPYVPAGNGIEWYDSAGSIQARVQGKQDPEQPTRVMLDISGDGASVKLSSSQELQFNATPWPAVGAVTDEGDVPEVGVDGRSLEWQPRGHQVLDQAGALMPRRGTIQFLDSSVTDAGSRLQVKPLIGFVGEVRMFAQDAANLPDGWLVCDGSSLNKSTYSELYSAIGGAYGESGSTFDIPDLRSRFVVSTGTSSGNDEEGNPLSSYARGDRGGWEQGIVRRPNQIPAHDHLMFQDQERTDVGGAPSSSDWICYRHDVSTGFPDRSYNMKAATSTDQGWRGVTAKAGYVAGNEEGRPHDSKPPYIALVFAIYSNVV